MPATKPKYPDKQRAAFKEIDRQELMRFLGISTSMASQYIHGHAQVSWERALDLEAHFGIPKEALRPDVYHKKNGSRKNRR